MKKYVHYYNLGGSHFWTHEAEVGEDGKLDISALDRKMRDSNMQVGGWDPEKQQGFFVMGPLGGIFQVLVDHEGRANIGGFSARKMYENARAHPYGEYAKEMS